MTVGVKKKKELFSTRNIVIFWAVFGTLAHIHEVYYLRKQGLYSDTGFAAIFIAGWFLWAALTPFMLRAVQRWPLHETKVGVSLIRVALLVFGFVALHMVLESVINLVFTYVFFKPVLPKLPGILIGRMEASLVRKIFIAGFIIAAVQAINYMKKLRQKELTEAELHRKLAEAQLDALRMQLQPHFLFNTHHSIISLMMKNENEKAINMLVSLCDLLRINLDSTRGNLITLERELDASNLYLQIQQVRFSDRLEVSCNIPSSVMHALVPAFILQPLIENSIKHGIEKYKDYGKIDITTRQVEKKLQIEIQDDGVAPSESPTRKGIGLGNSEARLLQLFGNDFRLELSPMPVRGTKLLLEIPFITEDK